ncbi:hypothetical protein SAMN05216298_0301 [Glycomyces sambucus]|uniref:NACHT domain-containing protein n=1 Tax=Glycomyces sambucus TaxID=380244 RepID=A0A1G9CF09_9ACTN|nr:hypothetical protein [Glycomyces sambucus]SDK50239.1 hypothetical protein SAMN05216298_0301 [Glycomyces sambucus]
MPSPPGAWSRARTVIVFGSLIVATAALAWWLAREPGRRDLFDAVTLGTAVLALVVAAVTPFKATSGTRPRSSPEEQLESLAVLMHKAAANEKRTLKLTGSDYIQVEWQVDTSTVPGKATPKVTGDIASIGEDWLVHRPHLTVILGAKGAGKSATALLLTHQLLELRSPGDTTVPVPLLLHVGGWDPAVPLLEWTAQQLADQFRLKRPRSPDGVDLTAYLARGGDIMLVIDGFDEIPAPARPAAFTGLQHALDSSAAPIVVTSRPDEFTGAHAASGLHVEGWSTVALRPVSPVQARTYLEKGHDPDHWTAVFDKLGRANSPVAQALSTPLMVFLCREVYRHQQPDSAILAGLESRSAVEQHLVAHYLPAVYDTHGQSTNSEEVSSDRSASSAEQAERYLRFIATHLQKTGASTFAWWELPRSWSSRKMSVAIGLMVGLMTGLGFGLTGGLAFGLGFGLGFGLAFGLGSGLAFGLALGLPLGLMFGRMAKDRPVLRPTTIAFGRRQLRDGVVAGLVTGLVAGLGVGLLVGQGVGLLVGLVVGPLSGLMTGLWQSISSVQLQMLTSREVFVSERKASNLLGLAVGLAFWLSIWWVIREQTGLTPRLAVEMGPGLLLGLVVKLVSGIASTAYRLCHISLAFPNGRKLPWRFLAFLEGAHDRGVLRQVGATYEFRHEALQTYLSEPADRPRSED